MTRRRRISSTFLAIAFVLVCFWWLFYLPHSRRTVLRAMPANASFVAIYENAAGGWQDILGNPASDMIVEFTEVPTNILSQIHSDEVIALLDRFAGREVAISHVQRLSYVRADAVLVASWIGNYGWVLRWGASLGLFPQLDRRGSHAKRPIWAVRGQPVFGGRRISLSVADGVLLCCISRDPEGVRFMVECFDRTLQGGASAKPTESILDMAEEPRLSTLWESETHYRGWVQNLEPLSRRAHEVAIEELGSNGVSGRIAGDYDLGEADALTVEGLGGLGRVLGDLPEALVIVPSSFLVNYSAVREPAGMPAEPGWWPLFADVLGRNAAAGPERNVFACMMGGEYRGRIRSIYTSEHDARLRERGLAVPSFLLGVQVNDAAGAGTLASEFIDKINGKYGIGLIERRIPVGDLSVVVIEATVKSWYSSFLLEERFAYSIVGDWLVAASNSEGLMKLVARYQRDEAERQSGSGRWLRDFSGILAGVGKEGRPSGFVWTDFSDSSTTLQDGLAVWKMKLVSDPRKLRTRDKLRVAQQIAASLKQLGSLRAWTESAEGGTRLHFSIGD